MDDDGFYRGECNGVRGLVPSNFLMEVGAEYGPEDGVGPPQSKGQRQSQQQQQQQHQQQDMRGHGPGARGPPPPPRGIDQPPKRKGTHPEKNTSTPCPLSPQHSQHDVILWTYTFIWTYYVKMLPPTLKVYVPHTC